MHPLHEALHVPYVPFRVILGGFENKANVFYFAEAAGSLFVFYCYPFLLFLSMGWYYAAGVFRLIGCLALSSCFAFPTILNNNNNNNIELYFVPESQVGFASALCVGDVTFPSRLRIFTDYWMVAFALNSPTSFWILHIFCALVWILAWILGLVSKQHKTAPWPSRGLHHLGKFLEPYDESAGRGCCCFLLR